MRRATCQTARGWRYAQGIDERPHVTLLRLIVYNALRHKLRTVLTVLGLAIAVLAFPMPLAYRDRISQVPGITAVTYADWFGGVYIDEKNFFAQFGVDDDTCFRVFPEYRVAPDQME